MRALRSVLPLLLVTAVTAACASTPDKSDAARRQRASAPRTLDLAAMYAAGRSQPVVAEHDPRALSFQQILDNVRQDQDGLLRRKYGPPGHYNKRAFASPNVYFGPALMLHEIRKQVGDKKFFVMLRGWVQQRHGTNQDRKAFTAWVKQSTGKDLTALINRWLDSKTTPAR